MSLDHIVVVGASLAGLRAVEQLRKSGFEGRVSLVGAEPHLPYDRPPLSKDVLRGEREPQHTVFRTADYFDELRVDLLLGRAATRLDLHARKLLLGEHALRYDGLILATGSAPRKLPVAGMQLDGIFELRTLEDAAAVRSAFERSPRVAIIGAGIIGAEVASSARSLGLDVTVIEAQPVPLMRAVGPALGRTFGQLHQDHGARLLCDVGVAAFEGGKHVERVRLTNGAAVAADVVVIGAGVDPAVQWLASSGLRIDNGLICDAHLNSGAPGVFAAGDMVCWPNLLLGQTMRQESWTSAVEQGAHAARNLLAGAGGTPCSTVPYFWSDQYGHRLQAAGLATGDEMHIAHGTIEQRKFVALIRRGELLVGAIALDSAKLLMQYRTKIAQRTPWATVLAASAQPH